MSCLIPCTFRGREVERVTTLLRVVPIYVCRFHESRCADIGVIRRKGEPEVYECCEACPGYIKALATQRED